MIKLSNITKKYSGKIAVNSLSVEFGEGEVSVIIGPSGCGKTTTLRMINKLIKPSSGTVFVEGEDVNKHNVETLRRGIGYVIQNVGLFPHMTVSKNISTVPRLLKWSKEKQKERIHELLDLVGLSPLEYKDKYPSQLSGGEAQRIGVARALAANPPILLMDEPFGAVDPLNREVLQGEFLKIQKKLKKTIVFVTHDLDEAIRMADKILVMKEGQLVQFDTPESILSNPANKFVRDFVGTNRALKRLSRFSIEDSFHEVRSVLYNDKLVGQVALDLEKHGFLWVVDENSILKGWVQTGVYDENQMIDEIMTLVPYQELGVKVNASLKEALSRMLSQGVTTVPVVDERGMLMGEINIDEIQARSGKG